MENSQILTNHQTTITASQWATVAEDVKAGRAVVTIKNGVTPIASIDVTRDMPNMLVIGWYGTGGGYIDKDCELTVAYAAPASAPAQPPAGEREDVSPSVLPVVHDLYTELNDAIEGDFGDLWPDLMPEVTPNVDVIRHVAIRVKAMQRELATLRDDLARVTAENAGLRTALESIIELARDGQGEWASVDPVYQPLSVHPFSAIEDAASKALEADTTAPQPAPAGQRDDEGGAG